MSAPTPLVVAHNASFEERQFARYDIKVKGVRDTLVMSRELRPDLPNHTLRTCCRLLLNLDLTKEQQTSDWSVRPLSEEQVRYARLDAEVALQLYDYLDTLEALVARDLNSPLATLMEEYSSVVRRRYEITAPFAHELAFLQGRENKLRETIRQQLIEGAPPYDGSAGRCSISKVRRTEINPQKVREVFPEIAPDVIREYVDRRRFELYTREMGLPKSAVESVLDTTGYNDRLSISIKDESGELDSAA
jgi:DNA polymerase III epsilon subunit-like protein